MAFILDAVPATISWLRSDLTYLMVNEQLANLLDEPVESFVGKKIGFYEKSSENNHFLAFVEDVFSSDETELKTELELFAQGKRRYFYFVAHKYRDGTEAMVVGIEITERKQSEQAQARQLSELQILHEVATVGILVTNEEELSKRVAQIIGEALYSDSFVLLLVNVERGVLELKGVYPEEFSVVYPEIGLNAGIIGTVATTGQSIIANDVTQFPQYIQGHHQVKAELCVPLKIGERVIGVLNAESYTPNIFTQEDERFLTTLAGQLSVGIERLRGEARTTALLETLEMRVAERTRDLEEANERLLELDVMKSKFVSDVSHELRTPITNLNLYLDLLERGKSEKRERYISVLKQESQRLSNIIEPILKLSRLERAVKDNEPFIPVDIIQLVERLVTVHLPLAQKSNLQLNFEKESTLPLILGNNEQLIQVFTNLIGNAIHYTNEGEILLKTAYHQTLQKISVSVQDSGIGILREDKPHLFERFYRGSMSGQLNIPGSGLGLAIVHEIIENHHGHVEVESEIGKGSLFTVWLPVAEQ